MTHEQYVLSAIYPPTCDPTTGGCFLIKYGVRQASWPTSRNAHERQDNEIQLHLIVLVLHSSFRVHSSIPTCSNSTSSSKLLPSIFSYKKRRCAHFTISPSHSPTLDKMGIVTKALYYAVHPNQLRSILQWCVFVPCICESAI